MLPSFSERCAMAVQEYPPTDALLSVFSDPAVHSELSSEERQKLSTYATPANVARSMRNTFFLDHDEPEAIAEELSAYMSTENIAVSPEHVLLDTNAYEVNKQEDRSFWRNHDVYWQAWHLQLAHAASADDAIRDAWIEQATAHTDGQARSAMTALLLMNGRDTPADRAASMLLEQPAATSPDRVPQDDVVRRILTVRPQVDAGRYRDALRADHLCRAITYDDYGKDSMWALVRAEEQFADQDERDAVIAAALQRQEAGGYSSGEYIFEAHTHAPSLLVSSIPYAQAAQRQTPHDFYHNLVRRSEQPAGALLQATLETARACNRVLDKRWLIAHGQPVANTTRPIAIGLADDIDSVRLLERYGQNFIRHFGEDALFRYIDAHPKPCFHDHGRAKAFTGLLSPQTSPANREIVIAFLTRDPGITESERDQLLEALLATEG